MKQVTIGSVKVGTEVKLTGTVDAKSPASVWIILDAEGLGRVVRIPSDVLVYVTGESPNYGGDR